MIENLVLREQPVAAAPVEIVERKGLGHPDTVCDALAENLSRNLCSWYLEHTGTVLHHNVDKALLRGGSARAIFGGGEVLEPIEIYLAGRATTNVGDLDVPVSELAIDGSREWLKRHLHALDPDKHVRIHCLIRHGSADLTDLFERTAEHRVAGANDTSFGVGYAPTSRLETAVLDVGRMLDGCARNSQHVVRGEDTKIMAMRRDADVEVTVACAMIAAQVGDEDAYHDACRAVADDVTRNIAVQDFGDPKVTVNAADEPAHGSYYLTVTGTSAESGDDGQVGRGNRANGLITPHRTMSLEAVCGKNPVNHIGKLYNVAAREIADRLVAECDAIGSAQCCLVSRIGSKITEPSMADIAIATSDGSPPGAHHEPVMDVALSVLSGLPSMLDRFMNGDVQLY